MKTLSDVRAKIPTIPSVKHLKPSIARLRKGLLRQRIAISLGTTIVALVLILAAVVVIFAVWVPTTQITIKTSTTSQAGAGGCTSNSIVSLLTSYNAVAAPTATVTLIKNGAVAIDSPGTVTPGTQTSATTNPYATPWSVVYNASGYYPLGYTVTSVPSSGFAQSDSLGYQVGTAICNIPSGSSISSVPYYSQTGKIFIGPEDGTTSITYIEAVLNSPNSQVNSFPAAFPTVAQSQTGYLQIFTDSTSAMRSVTLFGTANTPLTDYGGMNGGPTSNTVSDGQSVTYGGYMIAAFNFTSVSFTATGAVPLTVRGQSGVIAYAVPLKACAPSGSTGVSSSSPYNCESVNFKIQEQTAPTGGEGAMVLIFVDNTQLGYIQQYFSTPAPNAFNFDPVSGIGIGANGFGLPPGFSGIFPPSTSGAPWALTAQYLSVNATD